MYIKKKKKLIFNSTCSLKGRKTKVNDIITSKDESSLIQIVLKEVTKMPVEIRHFGRRENYMCEAGGEMYQFRCAYFQGLKQYIL